MDETTTSEDAEFLRIDFTGAAWFGVAVVGAGIPLAGLLASGWRPSDLPPGLAGLWWAGAALLVAAICCLAWAGCPVMGRSFESTLRGKSLMVRVGLALFGLGGVASLLGVLLPAP